MRLDSDTVVFDSVTPNPKRHQVMAGVDAYRNARCDVIIALAAVVC